MNLGQFVVEYASELSGKEYAMNPYIYLGGAILAEVIGTTLMKFSEGFTRLWPSVGTIICISADTGLYSNGNCLCYLVRCWYRAD